MARSLTFALLARGYAISGGADNVVANPGVGGATFATDDDGTAHHPYTKLEWGPDNTQTKVDVGASAVPVQDGGNSLTVDGTVAVSSVTTAVVPGTSATHLGKAEDAAHSSGDTGVMLLAVRETTATDLSAGNTDGDYEPLQVDASGRLWVNASGAAVPVTDNSGSLTVDGTVTAAQGTAANLNMTEASAASILTSVQLIDDVVYTDDTSTHATGTSKGALIMAAATPTDAAVNANDIGAVAMTTDRKLHVSVQDALPAGTNGIGKLTANSGVTIGAVEIAAAQTLATVTTVSTVTNVTNIATSVTPGTAAGNLGKAEDAAHSSGDTGVMLLAVREATPADLSVGATDGDYEPLEVDAAGVLWVRHNDRIAHDAADAGNGIKLAAKAKSSLTGITLVAADDRTDVFTDIDGVLVVKTGAPSGNIVSERVSNTDGASTGFSTFGAAANLRNYITAVTVHNAHATTNGYVDLRDGTAGAIIWTFPLPATGGATHNFDPPLRQPTTNTALAFDVSAAISTIYISINGFQSKA
jgi:hypothetical protein